MAHDPSKTEKATPKRRQKAREDGTVLRIPDLDASVILWGNIFLFSFAWGAASLLMARQLAYFLKKATEPNVISELGMQTIAVDLLSISWRIMIPFLGVNFLLALGNQFAQHGFKPSFKTIKPNFSRLNPASGFKNLFSPKSFVEIAKSLGKLFIVIWVAYLFVSPKLPLILQTMKMPLNQSIEIMQDLLFVLYRNVMLAMLLIALIDFFYQKHSFEDSLKMSKQEVSEEAKDAEGNPQIKGKQRSLMFSSAIRRIRTQVPKASVVITNPTHFAVALKYDEKTSAPICVAKGADNIAMQIRKIAKESDVPIIENPPLARSLYRSVEVDQSIPQELYQAVAQVLAYVYRLKGVA